MAVCVRAGGHSVPGFSVVDDALVIDLRNLKDTEVDPAARTARVGAGLNWGQMDAATQEHGLAVSGGRVTTTGVAGFTLGSGSGWLERAMGLAPDNVLAMRVVTADGRTWSPPTGGEPRPLLGAARRWRQLRRRHRVHVPPHGHRPDRARRGALLPV